VLVQPWEGKEPNCYGVGTSSAALGVSVRLNRQMTSGRQDRNAVAILFFTHRFDDAAVGHLKKLKEESVDCGTFFVYADVGGEDPKVSKEELVTFNFEDIKKDYPRILGNALIPGNCHLALLDFFKNHPGFQYYWVIEYDVMFTGHWSSFFSAFAALNVDFLGCHLRRQEEEPHWYFWPSIQAPDRSALPTRLIRAFCPIQRLSHRALELLEIKVREGWAGHFEGLVPTLLNEFGYSVADIGGDGSYVPHGLRNRFYTSFSWNDGSLLHFGSMRFRPSFVSSCFVGRELIYHPVKACSRHSLFKAVLAGLAQKLLYIGQKLATCPLDFSRALTRLYFS
jgi:hypothetical protein